MNSHLFFVSLRNWRCFKPDLQADRLIHRRQLVYIKPWGFFVEWNFRERISRLHGHLVNRSIFDQKLYLLIVLTNHYFCPQGELHKFQTCLLKLQVEKAIRRLKVVDETHPEGSQWSIATNMWTLSNVGTNKVTMQDFEVRWNV